MSQTVQRLPTSEVTRRLTKRQKMSLQFQSWAPPQMARAPLERIVPHVAADGLACGLSLTGGKLTVSLARRAAAVVRAEAWVPHGYARVSDFAREKLDRSSRWLWDLAALGEGLSLPGLEEALWGGDGKRPVGRVAATLIARVATSETVGAWIDLARESTVRALQQAVREARRAGSQAPVGEAAERATPGEGSPEAPAPADPAGAAIPQAPAAPTTLPAPRGAATRRVLGPELEDDETCEVQFSVPASVRAAFEEGLELHRAVTGQRASPSAFAEALAAEAAAGACPPDVEIVQLERVDRARALEERLAVDSRSWKILGLPQLGRAGVDLETNRKLALRAGRLLPFDPTATDSRPEMAAVRTLLGHIESRTALEPTEDAKKLVRELRELVSLESQVERSLGRLLAEMDRRGDWACLQFRNLAHYAEERLGISRRTAERRTGLVRALRPLPRIRAAYESGQIGQHAAWLLYGIFKRGAAASRHAAAGPTALQALDARFGETWLARAREATVKRLGDDARWTVLLEHGMLALEAACGSFPQPPTDAAWHASLRRVPGLARERVVRLGWQALDRDDDNVCLRLHLAEDVAALFLASVEGARRDLHDRARESVEAMPGSLPALTAARRFRERDLPVPAWAGLLALLEDYVRVWDDPHGVKKRVWDATYERDGYRCMAPGCTAQCRIEDHHIHYRAHQGSDDPWNQLCLCTFHHQQGEHGRLARCRGKAPLDVTWRLGEPAIGTWYRNERRTQRRLG